MATAPAPAVRDAGVAYTQGNAPAEVVQDGNIQTGYYVNQQAVTVGAVGSTVQVGDCIYNKTNFYIQQTSLYTPTRRLRTFISNLWFHTGMITGLIVQYTILLVLSCVLGKIEPSVGRYIGCLIVGLIALLSAVPGLLACIQHLHVIRCTIPWVLRQPVVPNLVLGNQHLEVTIANLEGAYLTAYNRGVGLVCQTTGKIKFQVLSSEAVTTIQLTVATSICYTILIGLVLLGLFIVDIVSFVHILVLR
jgi:hypothetical protein